MFNGNVVILDHCEAVEVIQVTMEGKAFIKRCPDKFAKLEIVDISRITLLPDDSSAYLKELNEKIRRAMSYENSKEHENSGE